MIIIFNYNENLVAFQVVSFYWLVNGHLVDLTILQKSLLGLPTVNIILYKSKY